MIASRRLLFVVATLLYVGAGSALLLSHLATGQKPIAGPGQAAPQGFILLYATKHEPGTLVSVRERRLPGGEESELWTYNEAYPTGRSGNLWTGLPANAALRPGTRTLAYVDETGLKTRDLDTAATKALVTQVAPATDTTRPVWSPHLPGIYGIFQPQWSPSGTRIVVGLSMYEGSRLGVVQTDGSHVQSIFARGYGFRWSLGADRLLAATANSDEPP